MPDNKPGKHLLNYAKLVKMHKKNVLNFTLRHFVFENQRFNLFVG
jgi:hypothetical protein